LESCLQAKGKSSISSSEKPLVVIVTGVSGAGLTTAMNALNDSEFYCIDNLPIEMIIPTLNSLDIAQNKNFSRFAFGVHLHDLKNVELFVKTHQDLLEKANVDLIFLTAEKNILIDRYSSTRRPHPLLRRGGNFSQVIKEEKEILEPIEKIATTIIDTTTLSHHALVLKMEERFSGKVPARKLSVSIISFGFKHGEHRPLDSMFDVRFLKNPYFIPELKGKTGTDQDVANYIMSHDTSNEFLTRLVVWHRWMLPKYFDEGKHYFRIGIGCTGGKHRSVCMAEQLGSAIESMNLEHIIVNVAHRDIELS